ncbi:PDZ domain-containing protein [Shewanella sp. C32]|uniref:PDZ domain-containing protein n=1 Tax=Shewanella electrica TaxID=515560 RepID=A0ABT2FJN2_9GAMM|nr:PDZ domain-containing protein [Shewanella electrica]MCH1924641.1 PDZ domain-containing protein [Shewanella electrica]MCS4556542.1 PDZ domain-containing protein [Shewanella electrica]
MVAATSAFADVMYNIDIDQPEHHLAKVTVSFPQTHESQLKVNLPVWRTGKYAVLPLADGVRNFVAKDEQGQPLTWQRTASGEWQVALTAPTKVTVSYQLYANELGQRVRHIDGTHAYLDASGVMMYSPSFRHEPVLVGLKVPAGWQSYSGMAAGAEPHSFTAPNYDVLIDSPIETGISHHRRFNADGKQYDLVVWGEGNYDLEQMVVDLKKVTLASQQIWQGYPFERYLFIVHATSGARGATEHINSTVIQLPRFNFREREDYLRFISTAAHEFVHTWNVKAYRPEGLVPYDFQQENMSDLLWMAEGSTSYFQNQLLLRAGIMTPKEFLEDVAKRIDRNQHTPGREQQSVAETSLNEWVAGGGDYARNHSVNIYSEGYLVSMALDHQLLNDSKLKVSYRDLQQSLYQDFRLPKGYNAADVRELLQQLSGKDYSDWWKTNVNTPISYDFDKLLANAGLRIDAGDKQQADFGMQLASDSLKLSWVERNGAAWQAGIAAGDELVAIDGVKVTPKSFAKRVQDFKAGDKVAISLFVNDTLQTKQLTVASAAKDKLALKAVANPSRAQKAFFKAWLGLEWPFTKNGEFKK